MGLGLLLPSLLLLLLALALFVQGHSEAAGTEPPLNILLLTADDMNYDTPGFTGGKVPEITPNLDRLASEGMWFVNAHVTVAVCQPSRECLMTGCYPHRNGATGFYPVRPEVPTLAEELKKAGYRLGILGKVAHLRPAEKFPWDFQRSAAELGQGRNPERYFRFAKEFLLAARRSGKPFFLMANSHDPHRPFAGSEPQTRPRGYPDPGRIYTPAQIQVPGFLPDLPGIRVEVAQYYSSAHRCDETIGAVLRALKEAGLEDSTLVMFLSDNGISLPFAKSNCYLTSTRTPWLVRWPGKVKPGTSDRVHFISGIDFLPTVLEAAGLPAPAGMDGRSFLPLLRGEPQDGRDRVFTCYNDSFARNHYLMRCVQNQRFGYIFNAWSNGRTEYRTEPMSGLTFKAMQQAAPTHPAIAGRIELLVHRVPEELYDLAADPDALHNLIADPDYRTQAQQMRQALANWMERTHDPLLEEFRSRIRLPEKP